MNECSDSKLKSFFIYFTSVIWVFSGLITIGSIYLSRIGLIVNLVMGMISIVFGIFFLKFNNINTFFKKVLLVFGLILGLVFFTAIFTRVFSEGFAVFG